ncbi:MAG TPA: sigma-70 family RNA polymerase sigma factor [Solirubrobacteraceae bacterium]|nr:sigma-70 family RNA polymerase sigma factor [Solirubrobacteraceae bacterium]
MRLVHSGATTAPAPIRRDSTVVSVVRAATAGDARALATLVARFDRPLRATARSYGLGYWDVDDVVQQTWMQFLEHGRTLREPAAVKGWLITTTRRHCLRVLQGHVRECLSDNPADGHAGDDGELEARIVADQTRAAIDASLTRLSDRQRKLLTLLLEEPDLSYQDVGQRLGLPIGSIGPTRARSLERLRDCRELQALR